MEGLRATFEEELERLSGVGRESGKHYPRWMVCHLQGQDADEELSLGSVEFEKCGAIQAGISQPGAQV